MHRHPWEHPVFYAFFVVTTTVFFYFSRFQQFFQLEDHLRERLRMPMYNILKSNLLTFFKTILSLEEFDELTILRAAAILDTNAFEIRLDDGSGKVRAIFLQTAMLSHDCVPNCYHVFDDKMQIHVRAASKLKTYPIYLELRHYRFHMKLPKWKQTFISFLLFFFSILISSSALFLQLMHI